MEKTKLIRIFLVIVVSLALVLFTTQTFATEVIDITNSVDQNATNTNSANTNSGNTANTNTNTNSSANTNSNSNASRNTNALANTNTNARSSSYNNTNLPSTGIAETGSIICIVFALVVSAVYAFKKIRDYKNI